MSIPAAPLPVSFQLVVRTFAPGWPAAVMGTGAFALATLHFSHQLPLLGGLDWALHWFNLPLFVLISLPWLLRWAMAWPAVVASFGHPVAANFIWPMPSTSWCWWRSCVCSAATKWSRWRPGGWSCCCCSA